MHAETDSLHVQLVDPKTATIPHATLRQAMLDTVQLLTRYTKDVGADPSLMKCVPPSLLPLSVSLLAAHR